MILKINRKQKNKNKNAATQGGLPASWTRLTVLLRMKHLEKIRCGTCLERDAMKNRLDQCLENALSSKNPDLNPDKKKDRFLNYLGKGKMKFKITNHFYLDI